MMNMRPWDGCLRDSPLPLGHKAVAYFNRFLMMLLSYISDWRRQGMYTFRIPENATYEVKFIQDTFDVILSVFPMSEALWFSV